MEPQPDQRDQADEPTEVNRQFERDKNENAFDEIIQSIAGVIKDDPSIDNENPLKNRPKR